LGDNLRGAKDYYNTVMKHMSLISEMKKNSKSLLYANIVLNNLNLDQVMHIINANKRIGWKSTIGLYHHLTETTNQDKELELFATIRLENLIKQLDGNPDILNLNSFIRGILPFLKNERYIPCPFISSPRLMTRTTIMENGDVHLCWGNPIGNLYKQSLEDIFNSQDYRNLLKDYSTCKGCWTTCYTQRYLLIHPQSLSEIINNLTKILKIRLNK
jgi:sulfatase maturation enzyme AslB (radical SAM superfamily)